MDNKQVAQTILAQLGGNKFLAMTGAKHLFAVDCGLQFKLPARFAKDGITLVEIKLNAMDLYDVTFSKVVHVKSPLGIGRTPEVREVASEAGIYADMLRGVFTEHTGLNTSL